MGTLLDRAEGEGRTTPRRLELMNLAVHGILRRLRMLPSVVPPNVGDRTSTAALAIGTAIALAATMHLESAPGRNTELFGQEYSTFGSFASPAIIVYGAWGIAFLASMAGFTTATRWIALATIPLSFAGRAVADAGDMVLRPTWSFLGLLILLACLVAAGRPVPRRAGVRWLLGWFLPAAIVFTLPPTLVNHGGIVFQEPLWLDRPDVISWSPVIALSLALVLHLARETTWAAAILLLAIPFTAAAIMGGRGVSLDIAWLALLACGAALAIAFLLGVFGVRIQLVRITRKNAPAGRAQRTPR